ncbi:MAG: YaiO family outer membrane beta-barrel protein [Vicinamibacterales bacterium]
MAFRVWCAHAACGVALALGAGAAAAEAQTSRPLYTFDINLLHQSLTGDRPVQQELTLQLTRRVGPRNTLFAALDQHNRFNELDTEITVGGSHTLPRQKMRVTASYTEGLGVEQASEHALDVKVGQALAKHFEPEVKYEFKYYDPDVITHVLSLGALVPVNRTVRLTGGFQHSFGPRGDHGNAFSANLNLTATPKIELVFGGGFGDEHVIARAQTEVLRFDKLAFTSQAGVNWTIDGRRTLSVSYQYQDRIDLYKINGLTVDWSVAF